MFRPKSTYTTNSLKISAVLFFVCCCVGNSNAAFHHKFSPIILGSGKNFGVKELSYLPLPSFEPLEPSEVVVLVGQTAALSCVVYDLGDKLVSWIRTRDLHILTSDTLTYTSDTRFDVMHPYNTTRWTLQIHSTQISDSGLYECQINTDPKMNFPVNLIVTDVFEHSAYYSSSSSGNFLSIKGPSHQSVFEDSSVTFTCEISKVEFVESKNIPDYSHNRIGNDAKKRRSKELVANVGPLTWTHNGIEINFKSSRRGISVDTDYRNGKIASSRLTLASVQQSDTGNYSCSYKNFATATVVLNIKQMTYAPQVDNNSVTTSPLVTCHIIILLVTSLYYLILV